MAGDRNKTGEGVLDENGSLLGLRELQEVFVDFRGEITNVIRRRTGNGDTAADLTHDLFLKLPDVRAPIPDRQQGRAYLRRMASNLAIDHVRNESRRREILDGAQVLFEDVDTGPEEVAVSRDQLRHVELALSDLPDKCREVLMLSRLHGYSHKEIAEKLGVSVSLVEKYQLRALRHCRDVLGDDF